MAVNLPWPKQPTADDDDEADRQMLVLAIAELALRRPGWDNTLRRLAGRLHGEGMFVAFKNTSRGVVDDGKLDEALRLLRKIDAAQVCS
jgi:hypothetical protein